MSRHLSRVVAMLGRWLRGPSRWDRALDDEMASVLDHEIDARVAAGMSPYEARRSARAAFGSLEPVKEQVRDARTGALVEELLRDVRYGLRGMRRSPGLSVAVVASLSVGLAVTVAAIAFVNAMLFGSYPGVVDQDRLVHLDFRWGPRPIGFSKNSEADFAVLRQSLDGVVELAASASDEVTVGLAEPRSMIAGLVSANYFDVFGARPVVGRTFRPEEERPEHAAVAVISHAVWTRDLAGDPAVVGRTLRVADAVVTVIGVAPADFGGASPGVYGIWVPLAMASRVAPESTSMPGRPRGLGFVGRPRPGVSPEQVASAGSATVAQLLADEGRPGQDTWTNVRVVSRIDPAQRSAMVLAVMPIPALVLVIACVNASSLLLARGARRRHELAIRLAIGAGRGRVVRQLVIESVLFGLIAAAVGTLLASWGLQIAAREFSIAMPIDASVLGVTLAVTLAAAVASGIAPAMRMTGHAPFRALGGARADGGDRVPAPKGRRLVIAQIALSIGVLATATQLVSLVMAQGGSGGTPPNRLLIAAFDLDQLRVQPEEATRFYAQLVDRVSTLPGVEAAGLARRNAVWTFGRGKGPGSLLVWQPGASARDSEVILGGFAGGDLFGALGLAVLQGRGFQSEDRSGPPRVAIVNEAFARHMDGAALGRTLRVYGYVQRGPLTADGAFAAGRDVQVVGVIESAGEPFYSMDGEAVPKIYLPTPLQPEPELALYLRTRGDADTLARPLREVVRAVDPRVPVIDLGTLSTWNERMMGPVVWLTRAGSLLGVIALLLTATGLLAVVSYIVSLRSREFAIRMALGSRRAGVLRLVLRQAMRMVVTGFTIGGGLALLATTLLRTQFRGSGGLDIQAFAASTALLVVIMLIASAVPAIRAARVDPVAGLKEG